MRQAVDLEAINLSYRFPREMGIPSVRESSTGTGVRLAYSLTISLLHECASVTQARQATFDTGTSQAGIVVHSLKATRTTLQSHFAAVLSTV